MIWTIIPAIAILIPGLITLLVQPGPRVTAAMQHLAAGLIMSAVAMELVPETVKNADARIYAIAGYAVGLVIVFGIRTLSNRIGESSPAGLLANVGLDVVLDGFLVGISIATIAGTGAAIVVGSLSLEVSFLIMATVATLLTRKWPKGRIVLSLVALSIFTFGSGLVGLYGAGMLPGHMVTAATALGIAALLYLVVEELLVKAHEGKSDTALGSLLFFVGFGIPTLI
ncbi:MAG: hypothetical protein MK085_05240 [Phycisphaerales bacterium]|nr:hypothetical protein [Phycisphaerales bacterium]